MNQDHHLWNQTSPMVHRRCLACKLEVQAVHGEIRINHRVISPDEFPDCPDWEKRTEHLLALANEWIKIQEYDDSEGYGIGMDTKRPFGSSGHAAACDTLDRAGVERVSDEARTEEELEYAIKLWKWLPTFLRTRCQIMPEVAPVLSRAHILAAIRVHEPIFTPAANVTDAQLLEHLAQLRRTPAERAADLAKPLSLASAGPCADCECPEAHGL